MSMTATVLASLLVLAAGPDGRQLVDRIIAVVNDDVITLSDLAAAAAPLLTPDATDARKKSVREATLENLIADKLLAQQVREAKIDVSPQDVDKAIDDIVRQNKISRAELTRAVEARGMMMAEYRSDLRSQIMRLKLVDLKVRSRVVIPEADIKEEYERRNSQAERPELISLRHLFFRWGESPDPKERARVLEQARVARARVVNGEDFAEVAKAVSEGPTASSGGDLGEINKSGLLPELARAAVDLQIDELSAPIETSNGVHVIRIEGRRKEAAPRYESQRTGIYQKLYQGEVERQMKVWIDELKAQSAIDRRL